METDFSERTLNIKKAVFPLAGFGSRMMPITKSIPKGMLPVVNKPLLHYAVEEALASGITDFIFVVGNNETIIKNYFQYSNIHSKTNSSYYRNVNKLNSLISKISSIHYIKQEEVLGLGHAVLCAKDAVNNEAFSVLLADDLIIAQDPVMNQMVKQFEKLNASIIAISRIDRRNANNYGILHAHSPNSYGITKIQGLIEKPDPQKAPSNLAITGRYILTPQIFTFLERISEIRCEGEIQLTDAINKLAAQESVYGYCYEGTRFDCGNMIGLHTANLTMALRRQADREKLTSFIKNMLKKL